MFHCCDKKAKKKKCADVTVSVLAYCSFTACNLFYSTAKIGRGRVTQADSSPSPLLPSPTHWLILPLRPFLWKSTWHHSPSLSLVLLAFILMLPEPMSMTRCRNPSSSSMAKKSALGFLSGCAPCRLPWLYSNRPLGSVVRKSKDMAPVFFVFHRGNVK